MLSLAWTIPIYHGILESPEEEEEEEEEMGHGAFSALPVLIHMVPQSSSQSLGLGHGKVLPTGCWKCSMDPFMSSTIL